MNRSLGNRHRSRLSPCLPLLADQTSHLSTTNPQDKRKSRRTSGHQHDRLAHRTARHKTHRNCCHRHFDKRLRQALARCMDNPRMNDQG